VESFDFDMRRRFAWKEIKANERIEMIEEELKDNKKLIEEIKNRLENLNNAIFSEKDNKGIEGLNSSYHIGPAYFLKLKNYITDEKPFSKLWDYHLEGLLREYLRGLPDMENKLKKLETAYNPPEK
jgi:hypothetical protein